MAKKATILSRVKERLEKQATYASKEGKVFETRGKLVTELKIEQIRHKWARVAAEKDRLEKVAKEFFPDEALDV